MARLLETRLPLAAGGDVSTETFNKLVRVLELNLATHDPDATPAFILADRDQIKFADGDVIWNLDENVLQVWKTDRWENLSTPYNNAGVSGTGAVGSLQVTTAGAIEVRIL
tara:strand:- start:65 stop:397 length:333 start_codon:yes stop_codon:yes gene_type:complete